MRKFLMLFALLMLSGVLAFSQTQTVTGTVRDEAGAPIPFASIVISGTKTGTTADQTGHFSLTARTGVSLIISALGHATQGITVSGNKTTYDVRLGSSVETMDELIVTAGGIKTRRKEIGTA